MITIKKAWLRAIAITGLVLAVLSFLGVNALLANKKPSSKAPILAPMWFEIEVDALNPTDPSTQIVQNSGAGTPSCNPLGNTICEVRLDVTELLEEHEEEEYEFEGKTVSQLIADGAEYTGPSQSAEYTRKNTP